MDKFNFYIESDITIEKSSKSSDDKYDKMIIEGRATTNIKDRQGEILEPSGFVLDDFLKGGMVNLEHYTVRKGSSKFWIGHPLEARIENNEFYVKAKLWKGQGEAERLWDTLLVMKENNVPRKLGWSIEGSKLEVDPNNKKRITKAKVNNIAVTFSPVGHNTYADIVKGEYSEPYIPVEYEGETFLFQYKKDNNIYRVMSDFSIKKSVDLSILKSAIDKNIIKTKHLKEIVKKLY